MSEASALFARARGRRLSIFWRTCAPAGLPRIRRPLAQEWGNVKHTQCWLTAASAPLSLRIDSRTRSTTVSPLRAPHANWMETGRWQKHAFVCLRIVHKHKNELTTNHIGLPFFSPFPLIPCYIELRARLNHVFHNWRKNAWHNALFLQIIMPTGNVNQLVDYFYNMYITRSLRKSHIKYK